VDKITEKGMLLIISGPSGSGKGVVLKELLPSDNFALSVSVTTRRPRAGEVHGKDYFFCTTEQFFDKIKNDELLEHATFVGNYYGTPRAYVQEQIDAGKTVVLEIDVNGALQVKEKFPESVLIFLMPPTMQELRGRLVGRNTETAETIEDRLHRASEEVKLIEKYDYLVINDEVKTAVNKIRLIAQVERLKPCRSGYAVKLFNKERNSC
jgi:guanylate kinase